MAKESNQTKDYSRVLQEISNSLQKLVKLKAIELSGSGFKIDQTKLLDQGGK